MELQEWQKLSDEQRYDYSEELAAHLPQSVIFRGLRLYCYGDRQLSVALFEHEGALFSLIPGGPIQLGYEARNFCPTDEQIESFQKTAEEYQLDTADIYSYVQSVTTPARKVTISPMIVEIKPTMIGFEPISSEELKIQNLLKDYPDSPAARIVNCSDLKPDSSYGFKRCQDSSIAAWQIMRKTYEDIQAGLAAGGLRLLTFDEWEYACGAGSTTLFRWGDFCPGDRYPDDRSDWKLHLQPNLFGLHIAQDPYDREIINQKQIFRGGDGGCTICGGYGFFVGWLTLATAYGEADALWYSAEDLKNISGNIMRRVIPLP
ncbi:MULTISPECIES: hypothetical protein [unclassified Microcoleus]|uniref:hypothetical protein n=1 Tax=unclassified Microcoleus TaxID=2642155 RepID=UPI001D7781B3|nr:MULTISPECIES: hypothetical protein [unclassified Microcoleus]MCC3469498.1 hypothetical protein [Microcoleus sp. PH2017_06_SFM_O_A]MCC3502889.1 hypothetical protein [Microcoleus sp. PH2017_19_SFW_U_A]TAE07481.1 MAG: hypothetical protein EAZ94_28470 [Oscillatoriales cyanobacterium]MCC3470938.1 hypothetical protein [Microcoleus sp. PH2017_13_LAR_U_A]MCC3483605.1 hypothetical protein [Microcoleus sp. PH2017_14_LAR_D_A]